MLEDSTILEQQDCSKVRIILELSQTGHKQIKRSLQFMPDDTRCGVQQRKEEQMPEPEMILRRYHELHFTQYNLPVLYRPQGRQYNARTYVRPP